MLSTQVEVTHSDYGESLSIHSKLDRSRPPNSTVGSIPRRVEASEEYVRLANVEVPSL